MTEKKNLYKRLWNVLNLIEDDALSGYRKTHPPLTMNTVPQKRTIQEDRNKALAACAGEIAGCMKCHLHFSRKTAVPGDGVIDPLLMIVGEGPGEEEDRTGRPFVGRAGKYLDKWLAAIGLSRASHCFIGNIVKCRPPHNRDPREEEISSCLPYLEKQIALLRPRAILCVGRIAAQILSERPGTSIGAIRGKQYGYRGIPLFATYHPSAVLRDQSLRQPVWDDLKRLKAFLDGLARPEKGG
ncbi:MAG: uracil-DNA glycosylase [Spirochaetales bacterium]|nr:uracil-DNA glycosylase [Spirochaetales bacterium]